MVLPILSIILALISTFLAIYSIRTASKISAHLKDVDKTAAKLELPDNEAFQLVFEAIQRKGWEPFANLNDGCVYFVARNPKTKKTHEFFRVACNDLQNKELYKEIDELEEVK